MAEIKEKLTPQERGHWHKRAAEWHTEIELLERKLKDAKDRYAECLDALGLRAAK